MTYFILYEQQGLTNAAKPDRLESVRHLVAIQTNMQGRLKSA